MSAQVLLLFRHIIKRAIHYPSKNRVELLCAIHEAFYKARSLSDPRAIAERVKMAEVGLAHLKLYEEKIKEIHGKQRNLGLGAEGPVNFPKSDDFVYF
jgi:hypothetical protein